jgi:hypothetical protein
VFQWHCHNFFRSWFLSLFGRCSAVDVTGLLAIIDLFVMFHLFCLVVPLTWFQFPNYMLHMFPLFPPCPCRELFIVSKCALCDWCDTGFCVHVFCYFCMPVVMYMKWLRLFSKFCSPALDFHATSYTPLNMHVVLANPSLSF